MLEEDPLNGIMKVGDPIGVIAGIIPTTNPTSTTIFKTLLALKPATALFFHRTRAPRNARLKPHA